VKLNRFLGALAFSAVVASAAAPATAAVFQGSTTGCFGPTCTSFSSFVNYGTLTFTGTSFGATIDPTGSLTLGHFEITNDFYNDLNNRAFRLKVDFTQPAGANPNSEIFSATLDGNIGLFGGHLLIDFSNTPIQFTFSGGTFALAIQDVDLDTTSFSISDRANLLGIVTVTAAVPEPSTWAMLILGFAGVGFMAYRRQSRGPAISIA